MVEADTKTKVNIQKKPKTLGPQARLTTDVRDQTFWNQMVYYRERSI